MGKTPSDSEKIAQIVIEKLWAGVKLEWQPVQSDSEADFKLHYSDGSIGGVEVTESVDRTWLEMTKAVKVKNCVSAKKCRNSWVVFPRSDANRNVILARIDDALAVLEDKDYCQFPFLFDVNNWEEVERVQRIYDEMRKLGIDTASVVQPKPLVPFIGIHPPGQGGTVSAQISQHAIMAEANKDDNKKNLSVYPDPKRHLFVYVGRSNLLAQRGILGCPPPPEVPPIPEEITHVWAAAIMDSGRKSDVETKVVVWKAERGKHWQSLGEVVVPLTGSAGCNFS